MHILAFRVLFWGYNQGCFLYAYIYLLWTYTFQGFIPTLRKFVFLYAYIYFFETKQRIYPFSGFYSGATIKPLSKETRSTTCLVLPCSPLFPIIRLSLSFLISIAVTVSRQLPLCLKTLNSPSNTTLLDSSNESFTSRRLQQLLKKAKGTSR
jgi:hypothetical protein